MRSDISTTLDTPEMVERYETRKFFLLGLTFFFVITAYTVIQALKDSLFPHIVGKYYLNIARFGSMAVLMPAIMLYAKLVDRWRRYYLLCFYASFYAVGSLVFAYFLAHPTIGIANTDADPYRIFGWLFYFFSEGFSPFVVSVFWAFLNSVSSPKSAKRRYGGITAGSKLGGMLSAGLCGLLFSQSYFSDIVNHQLVLLFAAVVLCAIPLTILYLQYTVPGRFLHGYEAAYKAEKMKKKKGKAKTGVFAGIKMFIQYPYVLGIFGMVFFYEMLGTVISYLRIIAAQQNATSISNVSARLYGVMFATHLVGFLISSLGTRVLLQRLGERLCLLLIPATIGTMLVIFLFNMSNSYVVFATFIVMKAVNYAFSWPVRESLYIPTVKEIKFKSKSFIDAFGSKFAKTSGAMFNMCAELLGPVMFAPVHALFFIGSIGLWFVTAWLLGKRFDWAVAHNEVIGFKKEPADPQQEVVAKDA